MSKRFVIRQGDVLVMAIESIPDAVESVERDRGRIVLAYGEVTGHAHAIASPDAELFASPGATAEAVDRYLRVRSTVALEHEEHATVTLPPGDYVVRRQRQYEPERARMVAD